MGVIIIKTIVKKISLPADKRTIVISDIHGSLELLKGLLGKVNYSSKDILILLGDIIEKGDSSLATLRYIIELSEHNVVHVLSGNCDALWEDIKYELDDEGLLRYMVLRQKSILNEMCQELSIKVSYDSDIKYIKRQLLENFSRELNWLEKLPHVIESQNFIFAHAGIFNEKALEEQDARKVMRNEAFMKQGLVFSKYVVVGHWPVVNYCREKGCFNPIVNTEQKIICIDGGNALKAEGQMNALIINNNDPDQIMFASFDKLPLRRVIQNQYSNSESIYINWTDNAVEILEEGEEFSLCRHISTNHKLWIKTDLLFREKDKVCCNDCTDYYLPLEAGDTVSIVEACNRLTLVKKDGIVGWIANEKLQKQ